MNFTEAVKTCFSKAFDFQGRASRSEYWFWVLFLLTCNFALGFLEGLIGPRNLLAADIAALNLLFFALTFMPGLSVTIRRLHDTGRTGWWWLINLVPVIGWIVMLFFAIQEGEGRQNAYGPEPEEHRRFRLKQAGGA